MSNKRYYWLKLKEDFFEDDTIQWLEEQENGKDYVLFYLKLSLKSLGEEGHLIRYVGEKLIPYDVKALAKLTNTPVDTVAVAMKLFLEIGLVSTLDTGAIYMNQINEMIGSETDSAIRMRRARAIENQRVKAIPSQCADNVQRSDTEIEIEIEKELDKEIYSPAKQDDIPYSEIVSHLNLKADKNYKATSRKTKDLIRARWNEGFEQQDFIQVIDNMTSIWKEDKKMSQYLRPSTLFGTKFEEYLNTERELSKEEKTARWLKELETWACVEEDD